MEIRGSREIEQDIARLEGQRDQAIVAEHRSYEGELKRQKQAEAARLMAEEEATKRRTAELEQGRKEDIQRDLAWPGKVRERCFVEAINPLFKSWNLCQPFLNEQRQGGFCDCCQHGYQNEAWLIIVTKTIFSNVVSATQPNTTFQFFQSGWIPPKAYALRFKRSILLTTFSAPLSTE